MKRMMVFLLMGAFVAGAGWSYAGKEAKKLYSIQAKKMKLAPGAKGKASFSIMLKPGAKVHPRAPFRCAVSSSKGLAIAKQKLGHKDKQISKNKKQVQVPVSVVARAPGKQHVKMDCSFYICTKDICARKKENVSIPVKVAKK